MSRWGGCGRVESNHHSRGRPGYSRLSSPVLSVRKEGGRPGSNRRRADHDRECCRYTTATMKEPPRTGTTGLEPAANRLTSECSASELRPRELRGWDSNPRLELMRLARKAAPPPRVERRSGRLESNQRSPVPETGGVASPLQPDETPGGTRTRASGLRTRRHASRPRGQVVQSEVLESNQALLDISEPCRHGHRPPKGS